MEDTKPVKVEIKEEVTLGEIFYDDSEYYSFEGFYEDSINASFEGFDEDKKHDSFEGFYEDKKNHIFEKGRPEKNTPNVKIFEDSEEDSLDGSFDCNWTYRRAQESIMQRTEGENSINLEQIRLSKYPFVKLHPLNSKLYVKNEKPAKKKVSKPKKTTDSSKIVNKCVERIPQEKPECSQQPNVFRNLRKRTCSQKQSERSNSGLDAKMSLKRSKLKTKDFEESETTQKVTKKVGPVCESKDDMKTKCFRCFECSYSTDIFCNLRRHSKMHMKNEDLQCQLCCYKTYRKDRFREHMLKHKNTKMRVCSHCGFKTLCTTTYKRHMFTHWPELNKRTTVKTKETLFKCPICKYESKIEKNALIHLKSHDEKSKFKCPHCSYKSHVKAKYDRHLLIHLHNRLFKCSECNYSSNFKSCLKTHIYKYHYNNTKKLPDQHLLKSKLLCSKCNYSSKFKINLETHIYKYHYNGTKKRPGQHLLKSLAI